MTHFSFWRAGELEEYEQQFLAEYLPVAESGFPLGADDRCQLAQLVLRAEPHPIELVEYRCGISRSGRSCGGLLGCLFRTKRGAVLARASVADDVGTVLEGVDLLMVPDIDDDQPIGLQAVMKCRRHGHFQPTRNGLRIHYFLALRSGHKKVMVTAERQQPDRHRDPLPQRGKPLS